MRTQIAKLQWAIFAVIALLFIHCGEADDCGGTETGNPACTSSTSNDSADSGSEQPESDDEDSDNDIVALYRGTYNSGAIPDTRLMTDNAADFAALWEIFGDGSAPIVDFGEECVIADITNLKDGRTTVFVGRTRDAGECE